MPRAPRSWRATSPGSRRAGARTDTAAGAGAWTAQARWAITAAATTQTGPRARTESPARSYANNADSSLVSPVFDLGGHDGPVLSFDSSCDTEAGRDFGNVARDAGGPACRAGQGPGDARFGDGFEPRADRRAARTTGIAP